MLVFVDESGDPGIRGKKGSSRYFIVTAVIFRDDAEATKCDKAIDGLRKERGLSRHHEFKFNKCNRSLREAFLKAVDTFRFDYVAFVLNKGSPRLTGEGFGFKESLYKLSIRYAFTNAKPILRNARVVIDKTGSRDFRKQLATYLRRQMNEKTHPPLIKKVKGQTSHSNNLVQMADMVCGAVGRSFRDDKQDRQVYRSLVRSHEFKVQVWPV